MRVFLLATSLLLSTTTLACSSSSDAPVTAESDGGADSVADGGSDSSSAPLSCSEVKCPEYHCECTNGSSPDGSSCSDGVCNSGAVVCDGLCGPGKVKSVSLAPATPDDAGTAKDTGSDKDTGPTCFGSSDPCGKCMAEKCCAESSVCAGDKDCQAAAVCMLTCKDGFEACAKSCNTKSNANFEAYSACAIAKGCSKVCPGTPGT